MPIGIPQCEDAGHNGAEVLARLVAKSGGVETE